MIARLIRSERGLTLVETLAALTVFSLITVGVMPLLLSSIRGADLSRSHTIGKNLAVQSMERVRGLPFFESVGSVTPLPEPPPAGSRRDVLDLWFPNLTAGPSGSGYSAATKTFTTVCTTTSQLPSSTGPVACPTNIADGYTVRFAAEFVAPLTGTSPEQFSSSGVTIPATYSWSSTGTELAPARLLRMTITTSWTIQGRARDFRLTSLVGDRKLSKQEIRGAARIDFTVQASTSFRDATGRASTLTATVGALSSDVDTRSITGADQTGRAAELVLTNEDFGGDPSSTLGDVVGATTVLHAPPNTNPAPDVTIGEQTLSHPSLSNLPVGFFNDARISASGVQVVDEQPKAFASFDYFEGVGQDSIWIDNQKLTGTGSPLQLSSSGSAPILSMHPLSSRRLTGNTSSESTPVDSGSRMVESIAHANFGELNLFPTTFIPGSGPVLTITDFVADLACRSTAAPATAQVTGSWSATLTYWDAGADGVGVPGDAADDGYASIPLSGDLVGSVDPLVVLRTANPLVYDDPTDDDKDVYLFVDALVGRNGYLTDLRSTTLILSSEDTTGRQTDASLNGAITLSTSPTDPGIEESALSVTMGKLGCEAVDSRGL